jgi:hypothetical protein
MVDPSQREVPARSAGSSALTADSHGHKFYNGGDQELFHDNGGE